MTKSIARALVWAALLSGCQGRGETWVRVQTERSFEDCPLREPLSTRGLLVVDGAADWQALVERPEDVVFGRPVRWATSRVVVVGLGPRATGGHSTELVGPLVSDRAGTLVLAARHRVPPSDAMVTQALTAPCLFAALERQGWTRAELVWLP